MPRTKTKSTTRSASDRGHALYARRIRPKLAGEKKGRVVALDLRSEDFQVGDNALEAARGLKARQPKADIWLERIGYPGLYRLGSWGVKGRGK